MEVIGFFVLLSVALIVSYFLDLHEKGWGSLRNSFNIPDGKSVLQEFKERHKQNVVARKAHRQKELTEALEKRKRAKNQILKQWARKENERYLGPPPTHSYRKQITALRRGRHTRATLLDDWDDEWESIARKMGIKLFEKISTHGTPGFRWIDPLKHGSELNLRTRPTSPPNGLVR
jgi:hypothetical protein